MSHFGFTKKYKDLVPPRDWLKINGQIATLVNKWAERDDLVVSIGAQAGGATAFYNPALAQIEINTDVAFGEGTQPKFIGDLNVRKNQFEYPKATGAIFHEAAHARFTSWDLKHAATTLEPKVNEWLHLLEESRIEKMMLDVMPENRAFLRSCILEIVLGEESEDEVKALSGTRRAARLCLLALARLDTSVLKKKDIKNLKAGVEKIIEPSVMRQLRPIWLEFQNIKDADRQVSKMYALAKKWSDIIDEAAKEDDEKEEQQRQAMQDLMDQLGEQATSTEIDAQGDAADQQQQEKWDQQRKEQEERNKEKSKNKEASKKVFDKEVPKGNPKHFNSGGHLSYGRSRSAVDTVREPTGDERRAAVTVGRALDKAKYHDRIRIESNSIIPPGRLRTRAVVQGAAYKSRNIRIQPEPFRRVQRKHNIDPNLTLGVMFDISGSMSGAMEPMGSTSWVMYEASRRIQAKFAMVSYGHDVTPIVKPGQPVKDVTIYTAPDGSEAFSLGFQALDGALDLLNGGGARLLVVVSDGNYKQDEIEYTQKWLKRCEEEGVAVLWVGYGWADAAQDFCKATNAEFIVPANSPSEVAEQIGRAAVKALSAASATRI